MCLLYIWQKIITPLERNVLRKFALTIKSDQTIDKKMIDTIYSLTAIDCQSRFEQNFSFQFSLDFLPFFALNFLMLQTRDIKHVKRPVSALESS